MKQKSRIDVNAESKGRRKKCNRNSEVPPLRLEEFCNQTLGNGSGLGDDAKLLKSSYARLGYGKVAWHK